MPKISKYEEKVKKSILFINRVINVTYGDNCQGYKISKQKSGLESNHGSHHSS